MSSAFSNFLLQSAPWITAVGAVGLGYLNHKRTNKESAQDRSQRAIEELHALYHSLVNDLGEQVERLKELNTELTKSNVDLLANLTELRRENASLTKTVKTLTARVKGLQDESDLRKDPPPKPRKAK